MINILKLLVCIILLSITITSNAQNRIDKKDFATIFIPYSPDSTWVKTKNKRIMHVFYLFYKKYISSQDVSTCRFSPTCSSYGMLAVQKKGLILGIIDTFDRLTRCNYNSYTQYIYDSNTGLYIDKP